jgi:elongation factor 1-gamma
MKVLGQFGNQNTNLVLTVGEYLKVNLELEVVSNLKDKEFLAKNPSGKCPILETSEGILSGSNAIVRFLCHRAKQLLGETNFESA